MSTKDEASRRMSFKSGDSVLIKNPLGRKYYAPACVVSHRDYLTMPRQYYVRIEPIAYGQCSFGWYYEEQLELNEPKDWFDPFSVICTQCGKTSAERINKYCGDGRDKDYGHNYVKYVPASISVEMLENEFNMIINMARTGQHYYTKAYSDALQRFIDKVKANNPRNPF